MAAEIEELVLAPDGLRLCRMQVADIPAVIVHENECYPYPWTAGIFQDCLRAGYAGWTVRNAEGHIIGHAVISVAVGEAHLLNLTIARAEQARGLGRKVLEGLLEWLRGEGARVVLLEVRPSNAAALRLYRSLGFESIGTRRGYYPTETGREDAWVFSLRLAHDG